MARLTLIRYGNSGDPIGLFDFFFSKCMDYKRYKVRKPNAGRKSDSGIVPMKSGNSDGGKARYQLLPSIGKHLLHTEVGRYKWKQN